MQLGCCGAGVEEVLGRDLMWQDDQWPRPQQAELLDRLPLLRRPFSLAGRVDDGNGVWLRIGYRVLGTGSAYLSSLRHGDSIDLIGPLGNAFCLPRGKNHGLLIGGGVGLPPLFYLAETMAAANWSGMAFVGATTADLLAVTLQSGAGPDSTGRACVAEFAHHGFGSVVTTDDGSLGRPGLVTAALEDHLRSMKSVELGRTVVFTCGPHRMMQAVAEIAGRYGVDCQVCLEQAMACGMGTCQSCVARIEAGPGEIPQGRAPDGRAWRYRLTCKDGPVFDAAKVIW